MKQPLFANPLGKHSSVIFCLLFCATITLGQAVNPFAQPSINHPLNASYGHPDLNDNGLYDSEDLQLLETGQFSTELADRADVNLNGIPGDTTDVRLLTERLSGERDYLPAELNAYPVGADSTECEVIRAQKVAALRAMLAIDQTDTISYSDPYWISAQFGNQVHINFHDTAAETIPWPYSDEARGRFNWPIYKIQVISNSASWAHGAAAGFVGDNPLDPQSWSFIEPQTDAVDCQPGGVTIPYDTRVGIIRIVGFHTPSGTPNFGTVVQFNVDGSGQFSLLNQSPDLILERPSNLPTIQVEAAFVPDGPVVGARPVVSLIQNYPNPFNQTTFIEYNLSVCSLVKLEVFDLLGRRIAVLQNGRVLAGLHTMPFSADAFASGRYIVRLSTPTNTVSRQVTLVK